MWTESCPCSGVWRRRRSQDLTEATTTAFSTSKTNLSRKSAKEIDPTSPERELAIKERIVIGTPADKCHIKSAGQAKFRARTRVGPPGVVDDVSRGGKRTGHPQFPLCGCPVRDGISTAVTSTAGTHPTMSECRHCCRHPGPAARQGRPQRGTIAVLHPGQDNGMRAHGDGMLGHRAEAGAAMHVGQFAERVRVAGLG